MCHQAAAHMMERCTVIKINGNQIPANSASATVEASCAVCRAACTHPAAPTQSSQRESAAPSAPMMGLRGAEEVEQESFGEEVCPLQSQKNVPIHGHSVIKLTCAWNGLNAAA